MNAIVGGPEIGQWYARSDKEALWAALSLERSEPPEDSSAPMDDVQTDDLDDTETQMKPEDWKQPLQRE
jgi:hypothetical protein